MVLHIVEAFNGGVERFLRTLLAQEGIRHFDHVILAGVERSSSLDSSGTPFTFLPWKSAARDVNPLKDACALLEAVEAIRTTRPSIIHCHSSKGGAIGRVAATLLGLRTRTIYTPHGISFLRRDISKPKHALFSAGERVLQLFGSSVVACSRSEQAAMAMFGIQSSVIVNAVDISDPLRRTHDRRATTRIVTTGRITRQKNPLMFSDLASKFADDENVEFIWMGDGEDRAMLTAPNIRVTGWLPHHVVKEELERADIYVSCAEWEGMPLAVLEAMERELPLVLSDCVGNRDLVDSTNGYLFTSLDEAVVRLSSLVVDSSLRYRMGASSRSKVEVENTPERQAVAYSALYESTMNP